MSAKKSTPKAGKLNPAVQKHKPKLDGEAQAIAGRFASQSAMAIDSGPMGQVSTWNLTPSEQDACKNYLYEQVEAEFGKHLRTWARRK